MQNYMYYHERKRRFPYLVRDFSYFNDGFAVIIMQKRLRQT